MNWMKHFSKKLQLIVLAGIFLVNANLSAKGIVAEKQVENKESWTESVDIAEKKQGKYNIVVTAQDQSGNIKQEGPHNIYIDAESDIPVAEISNPRENMHVPGNLNIVGTCFDDDEVLRVEIILDDDMDHIIVPEGKEYWSYYLDTSHMEEGLHKITVYGVDVNEVSGRFTKNEKTVYWHLDRNQPKVEVTNFEMGAKVSGT
ncbi:MAG: BNR domain protein, partial [Treponemataceae bacterium]|nr:BNR domain protein [Treponemataceae bacterium]